MSIEMDFNGLINSEVGIQKSELETLLNLNKFAKKPNIVRLKLILFRFEIFNLLIKRFNTRRLVFHICLLLFCFIHFSACTKSQPTWDDYIQEGSMAIVNNDYTKSSQLFQESLDAAKNWPQKAESYNNIAISQIFNKNYAGAIVTLDKAKALYNAPAKSINDDKSIILAANAQIRTYMLIGEACMGRGQYSKSEEALKYAVFLIEKDRYLFGKYLPTISKARKKLNKLK